MLVTFETKCWEKDWRFITKGPYLACQIHRNNFKFAKRTLFINNVDDREKVAFAARKLVWEGILTNYIVVEDFAKEALQFFGLTEEDLGRGYVYSISELVSIYLCQTPYLLHYSGDSILGTCFNWVTPALEEMEKHPSFAVANPCWNNCFTEADQECFARDDTFYHGYGFSDQCYLIRTNDFRARIYHEWHPASQRYPSYGGELFEKRVDSWMRNNKRSRLTHRFCSYIHPAF